MQTRYLTCIVKKPIIKNTIKKMKGFSMIVSQFLEATMLICFGLSWPTNAYKSYKAQTATGTSWQFLALITAGYLSGIAAKLFAEDVSWVLAVYIINLILLLVNWWVFFRNKKLDAKRAKQNLTKQDSNSGHLHLPSQ